MIHKLTALRSRASVASVSFAAALALALACLVSVKAQSPARVSSNRLSARERVELFEQVWKTIDEKYYDPSFNGVDWKAVRERYRPRVETVAGDEEFYDLLNQMA